MSEFVKYVFEELKEFHPFFRYPLLTSGDYEPYLHQAEVFYRLLPRTPVRFLIADDVGLGKTIEGIMVIDQLVKRRGVRKVLLILPKVLIKQWVNELSKFRSEWNLQVVEYSGEEPRDDGIYVISVDTIKRENHKKKFLDHPWDLIVVDEIHKVGVVGSKENLRYKTVAELVSRNPDKNFLGLSATPHRGNDNDYMKRLNLIDPYLREADDELLRRSVRAIIQKRNKNVVNRVYEKEEIFPQAYFIQYLVEPTPDEDKYYQKLRDLALTVLKEYSDKTGKGLKGLPLLSFMIGRRALSSPYAGLMTFQRMVEKRAAYIYDEEVIEEAEEYAEEEESEEEEPDELVNKLVSMVEKISADFLSKYEGEIRQLLDLAKRVMENDSRVKAVIDLAKAHIDKGDKVIIFTEYKDTANYIYGKFKEVLKLSDKEVKVVDSETVAKEGIERVKKWLEKGKVMIATDVASEGLNLQLANVLIHYELPLSIVKFEQRNGRVWRLKQTKPVYIYYLALNTEIEQSILNNYYNKLLEITKGTGSEVSVADALVYKNGKVNKVFNLSEDKEAIPVYLAYNDPQKREEEITPLKVWEAVIEGKVNDIISLMLDRINKLKQTMKKFALYENPQGSALIEIDEVRRLTGFKNRSEVKESLKVLLEALVRKVNGRIENGKIFYLSHVINDYDPSRIGVIINSIYQILSRISRGSKPFVLCDSLDYNVYLVNANLGTLTIPLVITSTSQEIPLSRFIKEFLPKVLECKKVYLDEVIAEVNKPFIIKEVRSRVWKLLESFINYRRERGRDKWSPNRQEDLEVDVKVVGGIIGARFDGDYLNKALEVLRKYYKVSESDRVYRLEGNGEVRYAVIVKPDEVFNKTGDYWVYSYSHGALIGVKGGV